MVALTLRKWTRAEYRAAAEAGIIRPEERLELLDGQIVQKMTQNPPHAIALIRIIKVLDGLVGLEFHVRPQMPITLSDTSEPEPDAAVIDGDPDTYVKSHPVPNQIELLVEVSDSSLDRDRRIKTPLYAGAGIKELWIVDVVDRKLEVHREPAPTGFRVVTILADTESISPLFNVGASVRVADLLPPAT